MTKGISLHIGVPFSRHDCCGLGTLQGCEGDVRLMAEIANASSYEMAATLFGESATRSAVLHELRRAADRLHDGDILFISYSGHGCQIRGRDERDGYDEAWCLADGRLLDDELHAAWTDFRPGVRIVVVSDSCHAGTMHKLAPDPLPVGRVRRRRTKRTAAARARRRAAKWNAPARTAASLLPRYQKRSGVAASVLLLAACGEGEQAADGPDNGLFTGMVHKVWAGGTFGGSYLDFIQKVRRGVLAENRFQHPGWAPAGAQSPEFLRSRPFSI